MGKVVEKKRKKKKGRPSLLDIQKRSIKEQQQQQQQQQQQKQKEQQSKKRDSTPNSATPTPLRRSTRRNPNPDGNQHDGVDGDVSAGRRREKKLNLVLQSNSGSSNSQSNAEGRNDAFSSRKRKIDAITYGSGVGVGEEGERSKSGTSTHQGNQVELGPSTPLPDKKLLLFILERLQKKDTYGVFSEPVDPEELPDYHEIIEHPMDFATIRNKLDRGAYANLEEFEKDVFLISSNAMEYNAPDTVYFRQARSIEELAKKSFLNLRQDSDDDGAERKIVRRGRPPTKNVKKSPGKPPLEHVDSKANSNAVLSTGPHSRVLSNNDMRRGLVPDNMCNNEAYASWLIKNRCDRNDESSASFWRSLSGKHGKQSVSEEDRRSTYFYPSSNGRDPPLLSTFERERKQLMAVGLFSEHGYAKSLARFAANLGPVVWKMASKKIERSLPAGIKFGPGWVGENDIPQWPSPLAAQLTGHPSLLKHSDLAGNASSELTPSEFQSKEEKVLEKPEYKLSKQRVPSTLTMECHPATCPSQSPTSSSFAGMAKTLEAGIANSEASGSQSHGIFNIVANDVGVDKTNSAFQKRQNPLSHPSVNGFNGFNLPPQMANLIGASRPNGLNIQSSQMLNVMSRNNMNSIHPAIMSISSKDVCSNTENSEAQTSIPLPSSGSRVSEASLSGINQQLYWQGSLQQQKPELRSPRSCQPDLALQL